ncbi:MAG: substrate-binding domain-containing protein [Eubacterium sp.]|nr:substrate-binding domain-containing protein [Eubacterium sp.]
MRDRFDKEKLIGLIVGGISNEFSKEVINGVVNSIPNSSDIRLAILPGELMVQKYQSTGVAEHHAMFNSVYNLGNICKMDGLIIAMGSIGWQLNDDEIHDFLKQFDKMPLVLIASDYTEYTTVNYDNKSGIREAIDSLINKRGLNRICMIGGYDANVDSVRRKKIFIESLEENGIKFEDKFYVASDMSINSEEAAETLIRDNPDVQAIFCVNDASAVGLYNVMKKQGLTPGKEIQVIGFDNTRKAGELIPPLSSVGSQSVTLGQKALELLLEKIDGNEVESAVIPTRLYGRESYEYDRFDFSLRKFDEINVRYFEIMFEDCFYRYAGEHIGRESVNLKRLFCEVLSKMFDGLSKKYIGAEDFEEICQLIDIFFGNGAMEYTDVWKFLESVSRLQRIINDQQNGRENVLVNRMFIRMKDDAIKSISEMRIRENNENIEARSRFREFMIKGMNYSGNKESIQLDILNSMDLLGVQNSAFYMFEEPVVKADLDQKKYPEYINLVSVIKAGSVYVIPKARQKRPMSDIFIQREIKIYNKRFVTFPIFYERILYGFLLLELTDDLYHKGEFYASQLGMLVHMVRIS